MAEPRTDFWRGRPVLVTGATGLLGTALVRALAQRGAAATALVRDWTPASPLFEDGVFSRVNAVRGDVADEALILRVLAEYEIDVVLHAAAQTQVGVANREPLETIRVNVLGTAALLEACRRRGGLSAVVAASSDKAYGEAPSLPYTEETPLRGLHPYDASKSAADLIARTYARSYGMPVVVTRCANLYGPGDLNWNRIVPGTLRAIRRGEPPAIRSDGMPLRDYLHLDDAAEAYLLCAERAAEPGVRGEAFNFGGGEPIRVLDLARRLLALSGSTLAPNVLGKGPAPGEIQEQWLSSEKAARVLGWKPKLGLEEGLRRTIAWYRDWFSAREARGLPIA